MDDLRIPVAGDSVSALLIRPPDAKALYVFAHGAGAGMNHKVLVSNAEGLAARGIATLRYQFPYMEKGSKRVDPPRNCPCRGARGGGRGGAPEPRIYRCLPAGGRSAGG